MVTTNLRYNSTIPVKKSVVADVLLQLPTGFCRSHHALAALLLALSLVLGQRLVYPNSHLVYDTVAREARTLDSMVLVCSVIRNRMAERALSADEVVLQPNQFSCRIPYIYETQVPRTHNEIAMARRAWDISETLDVKVNLFHSHGINPYWANHPDVRFVTEIDGILFYYER